MIKPKETKMTGSKKDKKQEVDARLDFVNKFFPDLSESPWGTIKLNKSIGKRITEKKTDWKHQRFQKAGV